MGVTLERKWQGFSRTDIFCQFQNCHFSKNIGADDSECLHNDDLVENDNDVDGDVYWYGEVNDDGEDDDEDQTEGCVSDGSGVVLRRKPTKGCTCMWPLRPGLAFMYNWSSPHNMVVHVFHVDCNDSLLGSGNNKCKHVSISKTTEKEKVLWLFLSFVVLV